MMRRITVCFSRYTYFLEENPFPHFIEDIVGSVTPTHTSPRTYMVERLKYIL